MDIRVPEVGESILEAEITKWHVEDGAGVAKDDLICELETDKIGLEIHAEADGVLHIEAKEGETVKIGARIARLETDGDAEKDKAPEEKEEKKEEKKGPKECDAKEAEKKEKPPKKDEEKRKEKAPEEEPSEKREEKAEPAGKPQAQPPAKDAEEPGRTTRKPMSPIRKRIARRLLEARQQTAMLTTFNEADLTRIQQLRRTHRDSFRSRHGVKLGLMSFFVKACAEALKEFPEVNARIDGDDILYQHFYDIGIAIGASRGLVVPVLRDADLLHFSDIEKAIADFAQRAEKGKLELKELEGGTFTITNGGIYGSVLSTPLLNPPQSAVLGMHAIADRAVVRDGGILIRPMMNLALSYDHRLIDGRGAVRFLARVKQFIEEPEELLLEM